VFLDGPAPAPLGGRGTARITRYALNEVDVDVTADGPAMLLLTDNFFPGWSATVDGEERTVHRSHGTFRAVEVPAGASRVQFRYRPLSFLGGAAVAAAAALAAGLVLLASRRRGNGL
jgi:uncharacterized membrane protein YfhO